MIEAKEVTRDCSNLQCLNKMGPVATSKTFHDVLIRNEAGVIALRLCDDCVDCLKEEQRVMHEES